MAPGETIDITSLPIAARLLVEEILADGACTLVEGDQPLGMLTFQPARQPEAAREGTLVVATAMKLSAGAREQIAADLGPGHVVVDLVDAPPTVDVVLVHVSSPQLVGILRRSYPTARIVVTEIDDPELGVDYRGPVSRLLEAGADAYLPPRSVAAVGAGIAQVSAALEASSLRAIT